MAEKSDWSKIKPAEVEKLIVELGKQNTPPEKIGLILRDQHGIPKAKLFNLKINKVLAKHNLAVNSAKNNIEAKIVRLEKHFAKHKHDSLQNPNDFVVTKKKIKSKIFHKY